MVANGKKLRVITKRGPPMRESVFETLIGAVVIGVAGFFLWFAMSTGGGTSISKDTYEVTARFAAIEGIDRGSDVKVAGVKVGVVRDVSVDFDRTDAMVTMSLPKDLKLALDADAKVISGLFGGAHISIEQGGEIDEIAQDGTGEIIYARGSVDLLTLFASFASGSSTSDEGAQ